ncbi:Na+/H+ antiporter NhaC family protein [Clostridium sp. CM028]|uniref:Na+/H+ antiporter NhaC family protein n=1 Tax=unclassified Clostridium TaxID=2614128 RepID=UPI001C0CBD1A|nr:MULTISPECIES: Na+/H+ antiporter NhaC family protein [unclassified Clostridium]MBU3093737.1 Na+/H+ antiporter NhaC family protein [Clostridium sp. CF011]MBW9146274.1 Na+/H+ antiporter NhaC family protein [Clostridium sp. CM027]MBW9149924.1 Na+/H+ antiporter NhaC family protein [Clostridium sp. CM028]UVE41819.1 Na+/H+ antiporter NhaC family protein [Clostridium sp. CM027]WAG70821.1 Na+/H+ antiporter NhaC family protein [Clostridium sp. CF011]
MEKRTNFIGLLPLVFFLILFMGVGILTGNFSSMPLLLAFVFATAFALLLDKKGEKTSLSDKIDIFAKAAGEPTIMLMVVIFILAGAFYSIADAMGAVTSIVNMGLSVLPANMMLPGLFIVCSILSFSMGTSMGTITALAPIGVGIASQTGMGLPLVLGTVVGGAMFGDNLSFISDTTIAATRTQGVKMRDKFKSNGLIILPAFVITVIILTFLSGGNVQLQALEYSLVRIIPYISIIASAAIGLNVMVVLGIGIATGSIIGLAMGSFNIVEMFAILQRGMGWMEDLALISIIVGGLVGLMHYYGGIEYLLENLASKVKTKKGAEIGIAALVSVLDITTTNNTISIITAGPLAKDLSEKYGVSPIRAASILDIFSAGFQGVSPYAGQMLLAATIGKISPIQIIPFSIYSYLMIVCGLLSIFLDWPKAQSFK